MEKIPSVEADGRPRYGCDFALTVLADLLWRRVGHDYSPHWLSYRRRGTTTVIAVTPTTSARLEHSLQIANPDYVTSSAFPGPFCLVADKLAKASHLND
jgi:hypothetical protein